MFEMDVPELVDEEGNFNIGKKGTEALQTMATDFEGLLQRLVISVCPTGHNFALKCVVFVFTVKNSNLK